MPNLNNLGIHKLDRLTYKDRDEYFGPDSRYRYRPNPKTRMPGTSPPFKRRTILEALLEALKIKPKSKMRDSRPIIMPYQDRYKGLI